MELFNLKDKVALVTGSSRGMGQAICLGLAQAGARVIGLARSNNDETKFMMTEKGYEFKSVIYDLADFEGMDDLAKEVINIYGRVDILVNNAGIIKISQAEDHSLKDYSQVMDVNVKSIFLLSQAIGRDMIKNKSGKIINTASIHALGGGFDCISYTASKHAVVGLTKALANEWGKYNIKVNAIAPGYTISDNTKNLRKNTELTNQITESIPLKRWAKPEDIVGPVIFLASQASDYVNGELLVIDGGLQNVH